jgi:hypothetical protein
VLHQGQGGLSGEWVSYRDFRDSAFFNSNFQTTVEGRLARHFDGRTDELERAALQLDGRPLEGIQGSDVSFHFQALPMVPLCLLFYDGDEEFPASCKLLFDRAAPLWLDMECLAVVGAIIADLLIKKAEGTN